MKSQSLSVISNIFGRLSKKYNSLTFPVKIIWAYSLILTPFLYFHENHLPLLVVFFLVLFSLAVSIALFGATLFLFQQFFKKGYNFLYELLYVLIVFLIVNWFGFFENRAGVILLIIIVGFFAFVRYMKFLVYYRILLIAMALFANGLVTFKSLQSAEIFLFNRTFKDKYGEMDKNLDNWEYSEEKRTLHNADIPLTLKIPEGMFFFNPKDLKIKEKTGSGQIAGILSSNEKDPNLYPYVRIFYVTGLTKATIPAIKEEYQSILDFEAHQGNIEEIKDQGNHVFPDRKWEGNFWTFYDVLRPRYSKTGFYIIPLQTGGYLIIDLKENLQEKEYHEKEVLEILNSVSE